MPRTAFSVVTSAPGGTVLSAAAAVDAANGNQFANTGREIIEVTNGAVSSITVTIITNGVHTAGGVNYAIADLTPTVTNGTSKVFGPFDTSLFNDSSGNVLIDWSSGTSITARVISVPTGA